MTVLPLSPPELGCLSATDAHTRLKSALSDLAGVERSVVLLFAEIAKRRLHLELGYSSMIHYATGALGLARSTAFYFMDLAKRIDELPALREAVADGSLGWTKAARIARIATPETEAAWVQEAAKVNRQELERKIGRARRRTRQKGAAAGSPDAPRLQLAIASLPEPEPPAAVDIHLRASQTEFLQFQALLEKLRKSRKVPRGWSNLEVVLAGLEELLESEGPKADEPESTRVDSDDGPSADAGAGRARSTRVDSRPSWQVVVHRCEDCGRTSAPGAEDAGPRTLAPAEAERIACDAVVVQPDGSSKAVVPPRVRRAVLGRDGHRCTRCGATRFLEVHHRVRRADGGAGEIENLVTLCSGCHQLAHRQADDEHRRERHRLAPTRPSPDRLS